MPGHPDPSGGSRAQAGGRPARVARRVARWARAPFRLFRFPGVLAAVVGAGLVLAVAGGSAPLFVSAGGAAALRDRVGSTSAAFAGLRFTATAPISPDRMAFRQRLVDGAIRGLPLGRPEVSLIGSAATLVNPATHAEAGVQMATRQGFLPYITKLKGGGGQGFWVPQTVAARLHVRPGSEVRVRIGAIELPVRVAGIYRDLVSLPLPAFWTPLQALIYPRSPVDPIPPPFLLAEVGPFAALEGRLLDAGTIEVDVPLAGQPTLPEARKIGDAVEQLQADTFDATSPLNGAFDTLDSGLPSLAQAAEQTVAGTTQPVQAISLAGRLVALVLVAAAGVYGVRRRRVEFELLSARGLGPIRLGAENMIEAAIPALVGAAAGWGLALVLVHTLGPAGVSDRSALRSSLIQVGLSVAAGIALFGAVAGATTRNEARERPGRLRESASRWPWEIAALALAGASLYEILTRGAGATSAAGQPPKVDLLILLFPFLFVAGTAGMVVRWTRGLLPKLKAAGRRRAPWIYLATSRLASAPRLATTLVTASALAMGILVYAGVLSTSVEATAVEKSTLSIGSDLVVTVGALPVLPGHQGFEWTPLQVFHDLATAPPGTDTDVLAIDPSTFPRAAYWNRRLGGSLDDMVGRLRSPGLPLRVIAVGPVPPGDFKLSVIGEETPVQVVAHVDDFPGANRGKLTLVADRQTMVRWVPDLQGVDNHYELWARGDPKEILPVLRRDRFPLDLTATAAGVRTTPAFLALSWTFGLLEAFGVLAGLIAVLGMVLYLQARQQTREVSYALARRMGLRRRAHRRSVLAELLVMLAVAFILGATFSTLGAVLVHAKLDPIPNLPPGPFVQVPVLLFAATAAGIMLACVLGARLVQRRADRANVAEVMRLAG